MGRQGQILARFGVPHFVKQHCRHQQGIDPLAPGFGQDQGTKLDQAPQGVAAQGLKLVDTTGE